MAVQFKVYFEVEQEIRRFNISTCTNSGEGQESPVADKEKRSLYSLLRKKITDKLVHGNFRMTWKDVNGDSISFDSEDELQVALIPGQASANGAPGEQLLCVYVKTISPPQYQAPLMAPRQLQGSLQNRNSASVSAKTENPHPHGMEKHKGVLCDGCDSAILGTRYKCLTCLDFDLCVKCESKGAHCQHDSVAIRNPNQSDWRKLFAARDSAYGRNQRGQSLGFSGVSHSHAINTHHQDGPSVALDLNLNQPLESLLRDVNTQVQKVLKGFMPQPIPQAVVPQPVAPPVVPAEEGKEFLVESVVEALMKDTPQMQVETLHESVTEQANAKPEEKVAAESIYPTLVTATTTETAEIISIAEPRRSASPSTLSLNCSDDEDWAMVSDTGTYNAAKDAVTETAPLPKEYPSAQIETALTAMNEMGFKNEGNLLRALLENFQGDIGKVLDTITN